MSNMAYHRCQCGYETDVSNGHSILDSEIHCRQVCPKSHFVLDELIRFHSADYPPLRAIRRSAQNWRT